MGRNFALTEFLLMESGKKSPAEKINDKIASLNPLTYILGLERFEEVGKKRPLLKVSRKGKEIVFDGFIKKPDKIGKILIGSR